MKPSDKEFEERTTLRVEVRLRRAPPEVIVEAIFADDARSPVWVGYALHELGSLLREYAPHVGLPGRVRSEIPRGTAKVEDAGPATEAEWGPQDEAGEEAAGEGA